TNCVPTPETVKRPSSPRFPPEKQGSSGTRVGHGGVLFWGRAELSAAAKSRTNRERHRVARRRDRQRREVVDSECEVARNGRVDARWQVQRRGRAAERAERAHRL